MVTDAAPQLTLDSGLSQSDLLHLGESLRGLSGKGVQFVEAPTVPYPVNPNWVEFSQPQDHELFRAIAHDAKLPKAARKARSPKPKPSAAHRVADLSSKDGSIKGSANCRSDTSAFAGPLSP